MMKKIKANEENKQDSDDSKKENWGEQNETQHEWDQYNVAVVFETSLD